MEALTQKIEERLKSHKSCRIFKADLHRVWPLSSDEQRARAKRIRQIKAYAQSNGWSVVVHDPGPQVTFHRKTEGAGALY